MNISKLKLVWKFLTGGGTGVIDYVLDVGNTIADKIPDAKREDVRGYFETASKTLDTLDAVSWLCPRKWRGAYDATVAAFSSLVAALADLRVETDELTKVADAFRVAYAAWRAE